MNANTLPLAELRRHPALTVWSIAAHTRREKACTEKEEAFQITRDIHVQIARPCIHKWSHHRHHITPPSLLPRYRKRTHEDSSSRSESDQIQRYKRQYLPCLLHSRCHTEKHEKTPHQSHASTEQIQQQQKKNDSAAFTLLRYTAARCSARHCG